MKFRVVIFISFFTGTFLSWPLFSQLNIKVGYNGVWPLDPQINSIIDKFNASVGSDLESKMAHFNSMHGLTLGLRYKFPRFGVEASWQSLSDRSSYNGLIKGVQISDKWFLSETEYSLGIENYFSNFGYGASIGWGTLRVKTDVLGSKKKRNVVSSGAPQGKFYLLFQYPSTNVSAAIKPYIQFPLGDYDLTAFDDDLFSTYDSSYVPIQSYYTRNTSIGVALVLYNGSQQ
jgi:hypothetical protein